MSAPRNEREAAPFFSGWITTCNGNCEQGRACDCVAAVEEGPNVQKSYFTLSDFLMAVGLVGACGAVVFAGPMVQGFLAGLA